MQVKVTKLRRLNTGNLKGFASVTVTGSGPTGWDINDLRIVQQPDQDAWVSMPQASYEKDGNKKYYAIIWPPENVRNAIQAAVLEEYAKAAQPPAAGREPGDDDDDVF